MKMFIKKTYNMEETLLNVLIDHNAHTQFNIKMIYIFLFRNIFTCIKIVNYN